MIRMLTLTAGVACQLTTAGIVLWLRWSAATIDMTEARKLWEYPGLYGLALGLFIVGSSLVALGKGR